jgi:hypothetical protein
MTVTEIRRALTEVRDAAPVPPVDRLAFERRVRAERRRRTTGRSLVAAAAAVVVGSAGLWAVQSQDRAPSSLQPAAVDPTPTMPGLAVVALEGELTVIDRAGDGGYAPGIVVEQVLGRVAGGVAIVRQSSPGSRVVVVPMKPDGELVRDTTRWTEYGGPVVTQAWLSADGTTITTQDVDGTVHLRDVGTTDDTVVAHLASGSQAAGADAGRWVERVGDGTLRLHTADAAHDLDVAGSSAAVGRVEIAGGAVAVHTDGGVQLFSAEDGSRLAVDSGDAVGALSRDGRLYAAAASGTASVTELGSGAVIHLRGLDGAPVDASVAVRWQDEDRFLVVGTDAVHTGNRILWDCSYALARCTERYDDPTGTLQLPTS